MMKTQSSNLASLTAREAKFLTQVSDLPGISYSSLVNSQQPSVSIQEGWDLVWSLLDRTLLISPDPMIGLNYRCTLYITPTGRVALSAYREACAVRRRDTVWKVITLSVSVASLLDSLGPVVVSAVSAAVESLL